MLSTKTFFQLSKAAMAFANLPAINSARDVEVLFDPWLHQSLEGDLSAVATYREEQKLLRGALTKLANEFAEPPGPELLAACIKPKEKYFLAPVPLVLGSDGFEIVLQERSVPGVKLSWLLVVSELIGPRRGRQHIVECNLKGCNRLIFRELRGGRPPHYCKEPDDHEREANRLGSAGRKRDITRERAERKRR
jgi:hypothetical protein